MSGPPAPPAATPGTADAMVEHLIECTDAGAAIVVDGTADEVIAGMVAAGWTLRERVDLVAGKRVRFLEPPKPGPRSPAAPPAQAAVDYAELQELREAKAPDRLARANTALKADVAGLTVARDALGHDLTQARSAFARLAGHFTQGKQSGWTARISGSVLRRLCAAAMCEPPSGTGLEALAEASDLVAERDALRALATEILDELDQWELLVEDDRRAGWRERLDAP